MTIGQKKIYKISNAPLANHSKPSTVVYIQRTQEEFLAFFELNYGPYSARLQQAMMMAVTFVMTDGLLDHTAS